MIELREITWDNFWAVVNLKPAESQAHYLPPTSVFMAQAYVNLKLQYNDVCFAIYNGSDVVGFTKIVFVSKGEEPFLFDEDTYYLDALMIDEKHQGRGYGKAALKQILKYIKTAPWGKVCSIKTACYQDNTNAAALYEKFGFVKTDRFIQGRQGLHVYNLMGNGSDANEHNSN